MRLKCAMLGLTTLKVALHKAKGTPLPQGLAGLDELELTRRADIDVCPVEELPPGAMKIVPAGRSRSASTTSTASCYAIEDRCSHDDGPLCEGDWDARDGVVVCPRHGANFDIRTGARADAAGVRAGRDVPRPGRGRDRQDRALIQRPESVRPAADRSILSCRVLDERVRSVL